MRNTLLARVRWCGYPIAIFFLVIRPGAATEFKLPSESAYLQDLPIVLSASRMVQPLSDSPNAVTIIDRNMIEASGFRKVQDLLMMVPGMYVGYQDGSTSLVSLLGGTDTYTRRMQVLVDGRTLFMPPFNSVDWEDIPLQIDDIDHIEVVRGPAAASHGSNSLQGVINIVTRDAASVRGGTVSKTYGSDGASDFAAHFGGGREDFDYRFTVAGNADGGLGSKKYYDGTSTRMANVRANYHPDGVDSFDFQGGVSAGSRAAGYLLTQTTSKSITESPRLIRNTSDFLQLTWLHTIQPDSDLKLSFNHISRTSRDTRYSFPILGTQYWIDDSTRAQRNELEIQHTFQAGDANRVVWGTGVRQENLDSPANFLTSQRLMQYRVFAHDEWHVLPKLVLNAGAMLENDGMGHHNTSPRVALNYHLTPEQTLRAGVSIAYRNPSMIEQSSNRRFMLGTALRQEFLASGNLRPERALSHEIGYLGEFRELGLTVDARFYREQVSDIIWVDYRLVPGSTVSTYDFRNEFSATYTGLESTVKYSWWEGRNSLTVNFARETVGAVGVGTPLLAPVVPLFQAAVANFSKTVPHNSGSILFASNISDGVSFSFGYYQQDPVTILDGVTPQPLMRRVDTRVARHFGARHAGGGRIGGDVALVLQNALQDNSTGYSGLIFNRRAYLTATIDF
ncbi:MAG: TonB-dependent receptor plug domain-containing protein [Sideroxydans sp.]|nr:TonB-dependent receptor plug domain-containing protein [Sideroxydans sp.]